MEITFYLAVPVMRGASLLQILRHGLSFSSQELTVLAAGMVTAFLVSLAVIRFLMDYVKKHDFQIFGWYRILLGAGVLGLNLLGIIQI